MVYSNNKKMELDKKQKTPFKIKASGILLILFVCLNMKCYTFYFLTEISWYTFILYSLLLSILCSIIIFYIIKYQIKGSEVPYAGVMIHTIISCFLGLLFYGVVLLFVPLGVNYYFAYPSQSEFTTTDYLRTTYNYTDTETTRGEYYCQIHFKHNGYSMRKGVGNTPFFRLRYTVQKGWLGFNVITDHKLE